MKLTKTSKSEERNVMRNVDRLIGREVDALNNETTTQKQDYPAITLHAEKATKRSPDKG